MPYSRVLVSIPSLSPSFNSTFAFVQHCDNSNDNVFNLLSFYAICSIPLHFYPFNYLLLLGAVLLLYNFSAHIVRFEMKTDIDK